MPRRTLVLSLVVTLSAALFLPELAQAQRGSRSGGTPSAGASRGSSQRGSAGSSRGSAGSSRGSAGSSRGSVGSSRGSTGSIGSSRGSTGSIGSSRGSTGSRGSVGSSGSTRIVPSRGSSTRGSYDTGSRTTTIPSRVGATTERGSYGTRTTPSRGSDVGAATGYDGSAGVRGVTPTDDATRYADRAGATTPVRSGSGTTTYFSRPGATTTRTRSDRATGGTLIDLSGSAVPQRRVPVPRLYGTPERSGASGRGGSGLSAVRSGAAAPTRDDPGRSAGASLVERYRDIARERRAAGAAERYTDRLESGRRSRPSSYDRGRGSDEARGGRAELSSARREAIQAARRRAALSGPPERGGRADGGASAVDEGRSAELRRARARAARESGASAPTTGADPSKGSKLHERRRRARAEAEAARGALSEGERAAKRRSIVRRYEAATAENPALGSRVEIATSTSQLAVDVGLGTAFSGLGIELGYRGGYGWSGDWGSSGWSGSLGYWYWNDWYPSLCASWYGGGSLFSLCLGGGWYPSSYYSWSIIGGRYYYYNPWYYGGYRYGYGYGWPHCSYYYPRYCSPFSYYYSPPVVYSSVVYAEPAYQTETIYVQGETVYVDGGGAADGGGYAVAPDPAPAQDAPVAAPAPRASDVMARAADKYLSLGDEAFIEGRYGNAVHYYARAIELTPEDGVLHLVLSDALFATGDYHYAAYSLRRALELSPDLLDIVIDKHELYGDPADFDHQLELLRRYVQDHVLDQDARLVLTANLLFGGAPEEAAELLRGPFGLELREDAAGELLLAAAEREAE